MNTFQGGCLFLSRNLWHSRDLQPLKGLHLGYAHLQGLGTADLSQVDALHRILRSGRRVSVWRKVLYGLAGDKLALVAKQDSGEIIGLELFYFESHAAVKGTLHEAFIGVAPPWRSRGLATAMRTLAVSHYALQGINRLTTDIDPRNFASRQSAVKVGFLPDSHTKSSSRMIRELK